MSGLLFLNMSDQGGKQVKIMIILNFHKCSLALEKNPPNQEPEKLVENAPLKINQAVRKSRLKASKFCQMNA